MRYTARHSGFWGKPEELMRGAGTESRCNTSVVRLRRRRALDLNRQLTPPEAG